VGNQAKSEYGKGRKDNMKIRKFEEVWTSVEMERVAKATERRWPRESARQSKVEKHNQKAPEDVTFIREKTYTLPITLARGLRIRARTKKRKKRRTEKPGGVPTHSRRSFPFQGTLGPQANCRSGPKKEVAPSRGGRIVRHSALLQKHVGGRA
jgi:hypothetical protein